MAKESKSPATSPELQPGQNVFTKIDGKKAGPFYFIQWESDIAVLQGAQEIRVKVSDLSAD